MNTENFYNFSFDSLLTSFRFLVLRVQSLIFRLNISLTLEKYMKMTIQDLTEITQYFKECPNDGLDERYTFTDVF